MVVWCETGPQKKIIAGDSDFLKKKKRGRAVSTSVKEALGAFEGALGVPGERLMGVWVFTPLDPTLTTGRDFLSTCTNVYELSPPGDAQRAF